MDKIVCAKCGGDGYYTIGYSQPKRVICECQVNISHLNQAGKQAERLYKALETLLQGLAKDGTAIEGFVDGWNAVQEYAKWKFDRSFDQLITHEDKSQRPQHCCLSSTQCEYNEYVGCAANPNEPFKPKVKTLP